MAQLAVVLLALFGQMKRTSTLERAAHLRDQGRTIAEIVSMTGIARTSLYGHLPPGRPSRSSPAARTAHRTATKTSPPCRLVVRP